MFRATKLINILYFENSFQRFCPTIKLIPCCIESFELREIPTPTANASSRLSVRGTSARPKSCNIHRLHLKGKNKKIKIKTLSKKIIVEYFVPFKKFFEMEK